MAVDFKKLLGHRLGAIEKPKPLPPGTYEAVVESWDTTESAQKKTPGIKVNFKLTSPGADVDMEELELAGGLAAVGKRKMSTTFWLTEDSLFRVREFIEEVCKIEGGEDRSLNELLPDCLQASVRLVLKHRLTDKGDVMMDVDSVIPAE